MGNLPCDGSTSVGEENISPPLARAETSPSLQSNSSHHFILNSSQVMAQPVVTGEHMRPRGLLAKRDWDCIGHNAKPPPTAPGDEAAPILAAGGHNGAGRGW